MSIVGVVLSTMKLEDIMSYLEAILNPQLGVLETAAKEEVRTQSNNLTSAIFLTRENE